MLKRKKTKIAIIGCGAIGEGIALFIEGKLSSFACLIGLCDQNPLAIDKLKRKIRSNPQSFTIDQALEKADLIIEAASGEAAGIIVRKNIKYKKDLVILSAGGLLKNFNHLERLKENKVNIYVPSGAICGVDALGAVSKGEIKKISLTTSKPPRALSGVDYFKKKNIVLNRIKKARLVFKGSVKEAVRYFPKNINVAATL
ncbi:MAG: DUF108 domain-containing protein, partial [Candidatus Omnitrophica bacterium]|nr:DUF108 domain-containing protein [Candidatus Omnitrophota bacterium]